MLHQVKESGRGAQLYSTASEQGCYQFYGPSPRSDWPVWDARANYREFAANLKTFRNFYRARPSHERFLWRRCLDISLRGGPMKPSVKRASTALAIVSLLCVLT